MDTLHLVIGSLAKIKFESRILDQLRFTEEIKGKNLQGLHGTTNDQYGRRYWGEIIIGINDENITEFEQLVSFLGGISNLGTR